MTSSFSIETLLSLAISIILNLNLIAFLLNSFLLTPDFARMETIQFRLIFFFRIMVSLLLLVNSFLMHKSHKQKSENFYLFQASVTLFQMTPFLDICFFLNLEYEAYLHPLSFCWICIFRLTIFFGFNLILFNYCKQKWLIILTSLIIVMNVGVRITRFIEWQLILYFVLEVFALCFLLEVFRKYFSRKNTDNVCLKKIFNIIREGFSY